MEIEGSELMQAVQQIYSQAMGLWSGIVRALQQTLLALFVLQSSHLPAEIEEQPKFSGLLSPDYCVYRVLNIPRPVFPRHAPIFENGCTVTIRFEVKPDGTVAFLSSDEKSVFADADTISKAEPEACRDRYFKPLMRALLKSEFSEDSIGASCEYKYVFKLEQ